MRTIGTDAALAADPIPTAWDEPYRPFPSIFMSDPSKTSRPVTPSRESGAMFLDKIVIELQLPQMPADVRGFLLMFAGRDPAGSDDEVWAALQQFLSTVIPNGVPGTMLGSNVALGPSSAYLDILLRPTPEGPLAPSYALGGLTLGLHCGRKQGRLQLRRLELTPHVPKRTFESSITGSFWWQGEDAYISKPDLELLGTMPLHRAETVGRFKPWRGYLDWKVGLVKKNQLKLDYLAWDWVDDLKIGFLVAPPTAGEQRLAGMEMEAGPRLTAPPTQPADDAAPDDAPPESWTAATLGEVDSVHAIGREGAARWTRQKATAGHRMVVFRLDKPRADQLRVVGPPSQGTLIASIIRELAPLYNQMAGLTRLEKSQGFCPRLADFMFKSADAGVPCDLPELRDITSRGGRVLNEGQQLAVRKAMAAPDLCVIQGPPGTGKTTVIADICLRAALAGLRVLVTSQTNLAVDNALSRLSDTPDVRRLRLGREDKIDEEFKEFLANKVIPRWFAGITERCRTRIEEAAEEARQTLARGQLLANLGILEADHRRMAIELAGARQALDVATTAFLEARGETTGRELAAAALRGGAVTSAQLVEWAEGARGLPADVELLGGDVNVAELVALDGRARLVEPLRSLDTALALVDSASGDASDELAALRTEKDGLSDSEDEADAVRLIRVNKRIRELESSGWARATGNVRRAAIAVFGDGLSTDLAAICDALRPSAELRTVAAAGRVVVRGQLEAAVAGAEERRAQAPALRKMAAEALQAADAGSRSLLESRTRADRHRAGAEQAGDHHTAALEALAAVGKRWAEAWSQLPDGPDGPIAVADPSPEAYQAARSLVASRDEAPSADAARASSWGDIRKGWMDRLKSPTDTDREQLGRLYFRYANVVGMTCNEAGKKGTWQYPEFEPFDIVIIDEVSKATPPELLMPMLLGKKIILVGDHRQLPPMFRERDGSFGEAASEGQISKEDFDAYKKMVTSSLFEELYTEAADNVKAKLWTQYRMHPHIMDVVNQFYEGRLLPGPDRDKLGARRAHHLQIPDVRGGLFLEPRQHLLWVDSSMDQDGEHVYEEQVGSGKANGLEARLVAETVWQVGTALTKRGFTGMQSFEVLPAEVGKPLHSVLSARLAGMPAETLDELFEERKVRIDGRAQRPGDQCRRDVTVDVNATKDVGVLTFYGAQLKAIQKELDCMAKEWPDVLTGMDLRYNTVDRFQGMEKPIIIASLVRSTKGRMGEFVKEYQRINVGFSRAQQLLVIIGAAETWQRAMVPLPPVDGGDPVDQPVYANILSAVRNAGGYRNARQLIAS